jgi:hypothetical protein
VRNHHGQDLFVEFDWDACMRFIHARSKRFSLVVVVVVARLENDKR